MYTWTETEIKDSSLGNPVLNDTPEHIVNASLKWQAVVSTKSYGRVRSIEVNVTFPPQPMTIVTAANQQVYDALGDYKEYALLHVGSNFNVTPNWILVLLCTMSLIKTLTIMRKSQIAITTIIAILRKPP